MKWQKRMVGFQLWDQHTLRTVYISIENYPYLSELDWTEQNWVFFLIENSFAGLCEWEDCRISICFHPQTLRCALLGIWPSNCYGSAWCRRVTHNRTVQAVCRQPLLIPFISHIFLPDGSKMAPEHEDDLAALAGKADLYQCLWTLTTNPCLQLLVVYVVLLHRLAAVVGPNSLSVPNFLDCLP